MIPSLTIRIENPDDYQRVTEVADLAFKGMPFSNGTEGKLIRKLRRNYHFVNALSLIAESDWSIIGHVLFTPIEIVNTLFISRSLALAPVSVLPDFQHMGVGSQLINEGHNIARELGYKSVIVLGQPEYFSNFGYLPASKWGITAPFDLPDNNFFQALELIPDSLSSVSGAVKYPPEFG